MLELQQKYIHKFSNLDYFFVKFDENINENIVVDYCNNIITIKGVETLLNITQKTILALEYFINKTDIHYDYIIRTNISTIINITKLFEFLRKLPSTNVYTGGKLETLLWYDPKSGINEESVVQLNLYKLNYIQGFGVIFSNDVINFILNNKYLINYSLVDDVTIGHFLRENLKDIYNNLTNGNTIFPLVSYNEYNPDAIFIRNNKFVSENIDRYMDIERMKNIVNLYFINSGFNKIKNNTYPKIIYLIHKTKDLLTKSVSCWQELNPEYKILTYDDIDCRQFLLEHYGEIFCNIFDFIKDGAIKCDFFRVCVLYISGGIYVDADILPKVPLSEFIEDDIDFATCISYNYKTNTVAWQYNPQFILVKKLDTTLYKIIEKYVDLYIKQTPYSYWYWSICNLFEKI
jgi:mannosyltransferase OCH1-like enzyme